MVDKRIKLLALAAAGAVIIIACVFFMKGSRSANSKENDAAGAVNQTESGDTGTGGTETDGVGTGAAETDAGENAVTEADGVGTGAAETDAGENAAESDAPETGVTETDAEKTKRESQKTADSSKDAVIPAVEGIELPEMTLQDDVQQNNVQRSDAGNQPDRADQTSEDTEDREKEGVELPFVPFR